MVAAPGTAGKPASLKLRLVGVAVAVVAVIVLLKATGALDYLSFENLAWNREWLVGEVDRLGLAAPFVFVLVYAVCTAFSLPTGLLLSPLGGFLFGTG